MKYIVEFGIKGGLHSSETITFNSNKEAAKLTASLVHVFGHPESRYSVTTTWYFTKYDGPRIIWQSNEHYVSISKLD